MPYDGWDRCSETEPVASVYRWCHADGAEKTQRLGVDRAFHIQKDPGFQALIGWCWVSSRVQHYPTLQCILVFLSYQMPEWSCMAWPAWMERERVFLWNLQETQAPTEEFSFFPAISTHDFQVPSVKRLHSTQNFRCPRGTCGSSSAPRERSCQTRLKGPTVSCDILPKSAMNGGWSTRQRTMARVCKTVYFCHIMGFLLLDNLDHG